MPKKQDGFAIIYPEEIFILSKLKSATKSVFVGLLSFVNHKDTKVAEGIRTRLCYPNQEALAKKIYLHQSSINRGIKELKEFMIIINNDEVPLMKVERRMNRSSIYTFSYPTFQHLEKTDLPSHDKTVFPSHDKTGTKKKTKKKEQKIYNRKEEESSLSIETKNKYKNECIKIFSLFDWSCDNLDAHIDAWGQNKNFINELYHIAAYNIEKEPNSWSNDYFEDAITKWLKSDKPSSLSKKRESYISKVHDKLKEASSSPVENDILQPGCIEAKNEELKNQIEKYMVQKSFQASMNILILLDDEKHLDQELVKKARQIIDMQR